MKNKLRIYDPWLFGFAALSTLIGLIFIYDAGFARANQSSRAGLPIEFFNQIAFVALAGLATWLAASIPAHSWKKWSKMGWLLNLGLLVLVMVAGKTLNGGKRWVGVGPIMIQPAEFAKLAAVVYLAGYFAERKPWTLGNKRYKNWESQLAFVWVPIAKRALPAIWVLLAVILIEFEKDLGTAAVIATTGFAMFFPARVSRRSIGIALVCACVGTGFAIWKEPYRVERIIHHHLRWSDENIDDTEYQSDQAEVAIASGGLIGIGPGPGRAKHVLPASTTDFIMATIGEETGLVGSLFVLGLLGAIVFRLLTLAQRATERFNMLLLYGVAFWIGIQTCVNVMMANAFLPAIGIPLPFISSGGSSLIALWLAMGACQAALAPAPAKKQKVAQGNTASSNIDPDYPFRSAPGLHPTSRVTRRRVVTRVEAEGPAGKY